MKLPGFARHLALLLLLLPLLAVSARAGDWWDKRWTLRKEIVLDASPAGVSLPGATGPVPVLVRLHGGNFQFAAATADGHDIRFVAADGQTVLPHHIESYDALLNEAFAWVLIPDLKPASPTRFFLYYGNAAADKAADNGLYDTDTLLVYHFAGVSPLSDATGNGRAATGNVVATAGSLIGPGLRLVGGEALVIPASPAMKRAAGRPLTWSAWIRPSGTPARSVLFAWGQPGSSLEIGLAAGVPYAELRNGAAPARTSDGAALAAGAWKHLAVVANESSVVLYVDGVEYSRLAIALPALEGDAHLGADSAGKSGFAGELDEVILSGSARAAAWVKFLAVGQSGSNDSLKLVSVGQDETGKSEGVLGGETLQHVMLFGDIAHNMMFDGWIAVGGCVIMMIIGWSVALKKFAYLKRIEKGSDEFLRRWKEVSSDLTVLDHSDADNVKSLGGVASDQRLQALMQQSPLYHIYHIGSEEIRHRMQSRRGFHGLSARSITAIKASLDAGLTREVHRLNSGLVALTIGIAGGPYVGLMGTVVGVMITFAVIAKTGQVEVNSIAPGIASALLATVFGLLVAIPSLFLYSFLNSRIKDAIGNMQLFIDEFITKMAEFYPVTGATQPPFALRTPPANLDDEIEEAAKR